MAVRPHIFLFAGRDSYTVHCKITKWRSEFEKKYAGTAITIIEAESGVPADITAARLRQALSGATLFAQTSLVIARKLFSVNAEHTELCANVLTEKLPILSSSTFLVIHEDDIDGKWPWLDSFGACELVGTAKREEYAVPIGAGLQKWIREKIAEHGGTINQSGITLLISRCAPPQTPQYGYAAKQAAGSELDLWTLHHEIEKCIAYTMGREITAQDIALLVPEKSEPDFFAIGDAILAADTNKALITLRQLIANNPNDLGSTIFPIAAALHTTLRDALIARDMLDKRHSDEDIATALGWKNPKRVYFLKQKIGRRTVENIGRLNRSLHELDLELRGGSRDPLIALEQWILKATKNPL